MERTNLSLEHPEDDRSFQQDEGNRMESPRALDSTRSQESVLVQVGQPFDEVVPSRFETKEQPKETTKAKDDSKSSSPPHIVMLMSTFGRSQISHQERAIMMFENKGIPYETIDGSNPNRKEDRNALFQLSGMRGVYPQFFLVNGDEIAVIGDYDSLEGINEASSLPEKLLKENHQILTWDRLLGKTKSERVKGC